MLRKTALFECSGGCTGTVICLSHLTGCPLCHGLRRPGRCESCLGRRGSWPTGSLLVDESNYELLISLGQAQPLDGFVPGRHWSRDDYGVSHINSMIPLSAFSGAKTCRFRAYPRSSIGIQWAGYTGPMYSARGRMRRLSSNCSMTWAAQPAMRLMAKMGV